ncbi:CLUMA_CG005109, isoform A [Clunio marinus]|uniref:Large ribosomal subunit protein mL43 n=1 Tax=Clunio marinus TaxID=568069 RepID=A0A1J1HTW2_9DIPT|nr:CLUMA_CG005109, isoform A [Clunio marinus]
MANNSLFLKSGFIKVPLQNGVGRFIGQLQRVTIKFCKSHGNSRGVREFIENDLVDFAKQNPGVVVYVKPRRHRGPSIVGEYLNGERNWKPAGNLSREEIFKWINLMTVQNGETEAFRYRKHIRTKMPSIQGVWTPFTHRNLPNNLITYPNEELGEVLHKEQTATERLLEIAMQQNLESDTSKEQQKD